MAQQNHSRSGRFATIGSTSVKSFRGEQGLDRPFKGNLGRLLFDSRPVIRALRKRSRVSTPSFLPSASDERADTN
jgi:hypothetical protein